MKMKIKEENFQKIIRNISEESRIRFYNPELSLIIEIDTLDYIIEAIFL